MELRRRFGTDLLKSLQLNGQYRKALADIVMKLSGDALTFLLLCFNQTAAHRGEGLFRFLAIHNIDSCADITDKRTICIESRHTGVEDPAILPVMPSESIFHPEWLAAIKSLGIGFQALLQIFGLDTICPAVPKFGFELAASKVQPTLVEIGAKLVCPGHPDQHRSRICD